MSWMDMSITSMKKIIALLAALALLLATGCAGGTNDKTNETTPENVTDVTNAPEDPSDETRAEDLNVDDKPLSGFLLFEARYPERVQRPDDNSFGDDYEALNAAYENFRIAYESDPSNEEFAAAFNSFSNKRSGGYDTREAGSDSSCSACDICKTLICAKCICDACDGDGHFCCC